MSAPQITVTIHLNLGERQWTIHRAETPATLLRTILQAILASEAISIAPEQCVIVCDGIVRNWNVMLGELTDSSTGKVELWVHIPSIQRTDRDEAILESDIDFDLETRRESAEEERIAADEAEEDDEFEDQDSGVFQAPLNAPEPAPPAAPAGPPPRVAPPRAAETAPAPPRSSASWRAEAPSPVTRARTPSPQVETITRNITVRYYERMNPQRIFPLLVVLSSEEIQRVIQKHVQQKSSGPVQLEADKSIEIEPVLPGCICYPAKATILPEGGDQTVQFWVVPEVLGTVPGASVRVSQSGKRLSDISLDIRVCKQTWAKIAGLATVGLPFFSTLAKYYRLDFESQLQDGFSVYLTLLNAIVNHISTPVLFGGCALLTIILYLASRPKKRDLFFDILPQKS